MPGPLDGIRVLDWTIWQQGPVASLMLGDMGADVIKIEELASGDPGRHLFGIGGKSLGQDFYFEANNRNKRSIALNLKTDEGRKIVHQLVGESDVFVQNFRKGVAGRLGLDYATFKEINPKLIYASATGYGPNGPDSAEPSFDHLGIARSGIMRAAGEPDMPPLAIAGGIADQMGAVMLAYGVMAALLARERTGIGQEVNASHLGSMAWLQGLSVSCLLMAGFAFPRSFRAEAGNPLWNHYRCADDQWLALAMLQPDRYWADLTRAIGRPELADDERFADGQSRGANAAACVALLDEAFAAKPRDQWMKILKKEKGDFIFTVVNGVDDLKDDPQMLANDYIEDFDHPRYGQTKMIGIPVGLSETPGSIRSSAPQHGQHTEEILVDILGYSWEKIGELRDQGVL